MSCSRRSPMHRVRIRAHGARWILCFWPTRTGPPPPARRTRRAFESSLVCEGRYGWLRLVRWRAPRTSFAARATRRRARTIRRYMQARSDKARARSGEPAIHCTRSATRAVPSRGASACANHRTAAWGAATIAGVRDGAVPGGAQAERAAHTGSAPRCPGRSD